MPDSLNQASSGQRRANWVALRTLRQLPKAVGETAGGEPVYEVRAVRLLLDGKAGNFVRLAECSRCGRQLPGAPVLTGADLDRPLRPMTCSDCIRSAGGSTVGEPEAGELAGERPAPAAPAVPGPEPNHTERPAAAAAGAAKPERLEVLEGHLRAVTDRVNELGRVARAHQAEIKERAQRDEATAGAWRDELAALRAAADETRAELSRLAEAQAQAGAERGAEAPAAEGGAALAQLHEEVAQLARLVEAQRGEVVGFVADVGDTQAATASLAAAQDALAEAVARFDLSKVEELIATRLADVEGRPPSEVDLSKVEGLITARTAEVEGRLTHHIASQWGDLETAIEGSVTAYVAGFVRANEELAGGQAVLEERVDVLADQMRHASVRMEAVLERLAALDVTAPLVPGPPAQLGATEVPTGNFLDSLDRQLEAAARRLAARAQAGAGPGEP